ncbi:amino acid adenylation domain-containing protein [Anaeromyxobacter oryzae]|uniref:D-alanine--poly(Phosphoribitol) ligase n=1 Tax=Anaeromyxobacter oryzae TaxID=2918170 RepID=A0ABM7WNN1_9BACT|nr:amino acid adenylation domain-containing protein [Anaeromyxobacter oryzae]BDG01072.1 D-alanine--poly(phosphoribitol) ligase [Anaeromyxobacter oryzae]
MDPSTLVECLDAGAARTAPGKIAVASGAGVLSYRDLHAGAAGIAARLAAAHIGRGDRVGVWMEKTPAAVTALLGVLRAGAAYVPLDPRSPWPRCRAAALDCGLAALVVDAPKLDLLPGFLDGQAPRLVLVHGAGADRARAVASGVPLDRLEAAAALDPADLRPPRPDDLAYVLYTSGSTGTPKGVAHTHASATAFVRWVQRRFAIVPGDVFSSHAPFHFDLSISDLWASLGAGASVRLLSATEAMLAPHLVRMLDAWGITVWYSVPSILASMLEHGLAARPPRALRLLLFAGEVFPVAGLRRLRRALPAATLVNLFGPTETNVCTYHVLGPDIPDERTEPVPIGIGCEGLDTFVVDDEGEIVERPGVEGTLWVKGGHVMLGYWNAPERTAAMLRPDPRGLPGTACCTGDRVRLLPGGGYEFRGRRDHMVKVRGHRVELGEIEAALAAHPAVREAVAVPLPDGSHGNRIVASVVPRAGEAVEPRALRAWMGGRLPTYLVPEGLDVRPELPRTSTGKADRARLRAEWEARGDGHGGRDGTAERG